MKFKMTVALGLVCMFLSAASFFMASHVHGYVERDEKALQRLGNRPADYAKREDLKGSIKKYTSEVQLECIAGSVFALFGVGALVVGVRSRES